MTTHGEPTFPIIALVGSAGGLEAVSRVLEPLPEDFRGSLVVLLHLPPFRASNLVELIRRCCRLPVLAAEHGLRCCPGR